MLRQTWLLSSWALQSIPGRPGGTLTTVTATAVAVGVLVALLSLGEGLHGWAMGGARADRAVVLSRGAPNPGVSVISRDALGRIRSVTACGSAGRAGSSSVRSRTQAGTSIRT